MLTKPRNLGTRRVCSACGTKYYDLNRTEPTCPKCSAPAHVEVPQDPRAVAMARLKADSARLRRSDDEEELPFGLKNEEESSTAEEEEEEVDEFGEFTEETSGDDDSSDSEAEFGEFED